MSRQSPFESKPKALVTGATGFVGSHLVQRLVQYGWEVYIIVRKTSILPVMPEFSKVFTLHNDGTTECMIQCVVQARPDVVFHVASFFVAQHESKDVIPLIQSNVQFGVQILEAMRVHNVKYLINTGTSWQHFNNSEYNPVCLYASTKKAFEDILEYYVQSSEIKAVTLKLFDTYGNNDFRQKLFNLLAKAAASGESLNMSPGKQLIDLVHINDVIEAYLIAAKRLLDGITSSHDSYSVSSGNPIPLQQLVDLYCKVTGSAIQVNWGERPYRHREVMQTWNKGIAMPHWHPKINLEDGIRMLLQT